jgi:hypothetical protein
MMMNAGFGRELAQGHHQRLIDEAAHDRLIGSLKRERREQERRDRAQAVRRKPVAAVCAQDVG